MDFLGHGKICLDFLCEKVEYIPEEFTSAFEIRENTIENLIRLSRVSRAAGGIYSTA